MRLRLHSPILKCHICIQMLKRPHSDLKISDSIHSFTLALGLISQLELSDSNLSKMLVSEVCIKQVIACIDEYPRRSSSV